MAQKPRAWQRMLSGRRLDLLDPTPVDVEIEDIAHGLAFVARWNGQTRGDYAYSVAEHSLLVETIFARIAPRAPAKWRLAALLHAAPGYVIGDMEGLSILLRPPVEVRAEFTQRHEALLREMA